MKTNEKMISDHTKGLFYLLNCMLFTVSVSAHGFDTAYFARLMFEANQRQDWLPDIQRINPGLDESALYAIQTQYVKARLAVGDSIGGFKGGFIPKAPVGGVLFGGKRILHGKPEISLADFRLLIVEAEIGFRFCEPVRAKLDSIEALRSKVCEIMPVIEIADGAIADFGEVKKDFVHLRNTLISMNVASSHTLLGQAYPPDTALDEIPVTMLHNGEQIGQRDMDQVFNFWQNVLLVVNDYVIKHAYSIEPGQFVIGGNLTGIHPAKPGVYTADYGPLGSLSLTVK